MTLTRVPAVCLGLVLCAVTGALVTGPLAPVVGLVLGGLTALAGIRLVQARARVPLVALMVLGLFGGYLVLNRNFAELHLPFGSLPVYIGELTLVVTLPWVLSSRTEFQRLTRDPFFLGLLAWQAYCAGRLLAGGLDYGIDALRDSAIWYYGLYAIVGYVLWPLVPRSTWMSFFALAFLGLMAVSTIFAAVGPLSIPIPGADPQFPVKADRADVMAVGLVAGATFFLLAIRGTSWYLLRVLLAAACLALLLPLEVRAASMGFAILLCVLAFQRRWRALLPLTVLPAAAVAFVLTFGLPVSGRYGTSSSDGLIERQLSTIPLLFEGQAASSDPTVDTAAWRVAWWRALLSATTARIDTTLVGAGFGTDLTAPLETQFGVQVDDRGRPVRSPHNILVTLFARTGMVGLGLWLAVQGTWFARIFQSLRRARAVGLEDEADLLLWLAGYVLLILVSATLGVVLEGPYGAIPYFLLIGMSLRYATDLMAVAESAPERMARSAPVARLSRVSALRA